ncbi:ectoine/hydroxyectoine ABC transporter substrate-binding protein EhuB [Streptomyces sp. DSM 44917]|uniref:Ectoine/hydroxyectoine ABC transporter substrate-binding protein EhuB n=1 Tax=Streptomyces boetiae TaxID=3075541 RepID=A0ABU2L8A7_9ACTN|nr:ectoine/hydroxyectoine ABC transporter substrate-binding protein EhuB [Streptomyces sp. DSM 44917]MDT0307805.1 ectoine/hydroxyectoine ABC transporter substrate-binding protein EhuB [Streptomyces sp. DSM 44917]
MAPPERERATPTRPRRDGPRPAPGLGRRSLLTGLTGSVALGALGALGTAGCSRVAADGRVEGGSLLDRLRDSGRVKIGIANEPPFGYIDDQGEPTGEAPEVAKVIFRRLGVEDVTPVPVEFSALIPGLKARQFDVVSAGMYINPTRCAQVLFSDPDYLMLDAMIVPRGNPENIRTYEDIAARGLRLATGQAYAQLDYALAAGVRNPLILPDQVAGRDAVAQGRVHAFAGTNVTVTGVVEGDGRVEATEPFQPEIDGEPALGAGGFAFRLTEANLRNAFNEELHRLKDSGQLLEIVSPFGFTEAEMTDLTAEELCG